MYRIVTEGDLYLVADYIYSLVPDPTEAVLALTSLVGTRIEFLPVYGDMEYRGFQQSLELFSSLGDFPDFAFANADRVDVAWQSALSDYASALFLGIVPTLPEGVGG